MARADGDPASDVLASQPLFLAADAGVVPAQQAQLAALLARARAQGFDLHVAVIASATDLGSITELWRQPRNYARFLGQELALVARGPLLVVMPDGFGTYGGPGLAGLTAPERDLGAGAIAAVQRLATESGHPLGAVSVTAPAQGGTGGAGPLPWVVFGLGWVVILAVWTVSLRVRPLRRAA